MCLEKQQLRHKTASLPLKIHNYFERVQKTLKIKVLFKLQKTFVLSIFLVPPSKKTFS